MCPVGWHFPCIDSQDGEETKFYVNQPSIPLVELASQTTQPWLSAKELNTSRNSTSIPHRLCISLLQQIRRMTLYRASRNDLEKAILLNTGRPDNSMCDARMGILSSNVQLSYLIWIIL